MSHDHHGHNHAPTFTRSNQNVFIIGIVLNLVFVVAEIVAGLFYNSMALLTDAGHNASDVASLLLSLIAFRMANRGSSAKFTYGFKKTTVLAALINAVVLLIAIGILGFESVTRLFHPEVVQGNVIAWIAGLGIIINAFSAFIFFATKKKI